MQGHPGNKIKETSCCEFKRLQYKIQLFQITYKKMKSGAPYMIMCVVQYILPFFLSKKLTRPSLHRPSRCSQTILVKPEASITLSSEVMAFIDVLRHHHTG